MTDLLLVNPGNSMKMYQELDQLTAIEPPFWCGLLASFIREHGYEVKILDADADNLSPQQTAERIAKCNPLLATIIVQGANPSASSTPKMPAASDILKLLKRKAPNIKTLIGGLHPSALPERTSRETGANFVCEGEGFYTILGLLEWIKSGYRTDSRYINGLWYMKDNLIFTSPRQELLQQNELPPVAWDLLDMPKYHAHNWHCLDVIDKRSPYAVIYTSLGCPYDCHFCQIKQLYSGKPGIRFRKPEEVIKEIDLLVNKYGVRHIKVMDELFTINEKQVARICDPIIEQGYDLNMWAYARVDRVSKPMLEKMKRAGINWLAYGIESASELSLEGVGKHFTKETIDTAVEATREADINIIGNFIFGLPDDDLKSMQATLDMAKEYNFEYVNFYPCFAYPGSKLYEDAISQGLPLPETWDGYAPLGYETLPLPTKSLPAASVLAFRDSAFKEYFSRPDYLQMIRDEFGDKAVEHIKDMLKHKIRRRILGD